MIAVVYYVQIPDSRDLLVPWASNLVTNRMLY
jgi:hypothetical protein